MNCWLHANNCCHVPEMTDVLVVATVLSFVMFRQHELLSDGSATSRGSFFIKQCLLDEGKTFGDFTLRLRTTS